MSLQTRLSALITAIKGDFDDLSSDVGDLKLTWVNFAGSTTINDSNNVTSITDHAVGNWTINITNAMANANYAAVFGYPLNAGTSPVTVGEHQGGTRTTTALKIRCWNHATNSGNDRTPIFVVLVEH